MIKTDDIMLGAASLFFSICCLPILYLATFLLGGYFYLIPVIFTVVWVIFIVKSNKETSLIDLKYELLNTDESEYFE